MPSALYSIVAAGAVMLVGSVGCRTTAVHVQPVMPVDQPRLAQRLPFAAVIENVVVTVDGLDDTAPVTLGQRLASRLRGEGLFDKVFSPRNAELAPPSSARVRVHITTTTERHHGANRVRKVFIISSLLLLWPLLPYKYDLDSTLVGTLLLPDGREQTYRARTTLTRKSPNENANHELWDLEARAISMNVDAFVAHLKTDPVLASWQRPADP
jgi:hypothetical protein